MTYYRLAMQNQQTAIWAWKSTVVTSLEAVFQLLRIYRVLPPDRLRVFSSHCKEDLTQARLDCEKNTLTAYSVTAPEFSRARKLQAHETARDESDPGTAKTTMQPSTAVVPASSWQINSVAPSSLAANGLNDLDKQRLEREMGPGGDHDLPYTFMLPLSTPQVLAWIRLLAQVQNGKLQP